MDLRLFTPLAHTFREDTVSKGLPSLFCVPALSSHFGELLLLAQKRFQILAHTFLGLGP